MKCSNNVMCKLIERYIKNELPSEERKMFEKHLKSCSQCRTRTISAIKTSVSPSPGKTPFGEKMTDEEKKILKKEIMDRIAGEQTEKYRPGG